MQNKPMKDRDMSDATAKVRNRLKDLLQERGDSAPFDDDESLLVSGRLDSLAVVSLVMFLEQDFGMNFSSVVFEASELDSVDAICSLVAAT
jgi:acyl carrier protein